MKRSRLSRTQYMLIFLGIVMVWQLAGKFSTYGREKFNRQVWHTSAHSGFDACIRGAMADDVRNNVIKKGMSKHSVLAALGPADREAAGHIEYMLGMCCPIDPSTLDIYFDSDSRMVDAQIVEH